MSESIYYRWNLEAQRRRQAYLDRISENTSRFRAKYSALLADLVHQGLEQYMPREFSRMKNELDELDSLISNNPEQARDFSLRLGAEISRLPALAREAKREFEARERQRQQEISEMRRKATSELGQFLQSLIADISDPIEQDFAFDGLKALQAEYAGRVIDAQELPKVKEDLRRRSQSIRDDAAAKSRAWKDRKGQETTHEAQEMLLGIHK